MKPSDLGEEGMAISKLGDEVLTKLDALLLDQLRLTVERVIDEIAVPADLTDEQSRTLSRATGYGLLAHMIMTIATMEGPDVAISTVVNIMVEVLEVNFPGIKIDKHIIAQPNTTKH